MRLTGLQPLYRSMREQDLGRTKFHYRHNHLEFECLFFIDTKPFELVMGCLGGHNFAIFVEVHQGFEIRPYIEPEEAFFALRKALFQGAGSHNKFDPRAFFTEFNQHIPNQATPGREPTGDDLVRYYPDMEHPDRRHFCGWLDNNKQRKHVTPENLAKTRRFMGQHSHDFSQRRNQSTRWTDDPSKAKAFYIPE